MLADETAGWYRDYYAARGVLRNDIIRNPEVLFQALAMKAAIIRALACCPDAASSRVLDVGCGGGNSLLPLLEMGFRPDRLYGIDILNERIEQAKQRLPLSHIACGDASTLDFPDAFFDIVMESTMFVQLTDEALSQTIAQEMMRVCRSRIILCDWRYARKDECALTQKRIARLFAGMKVQRVFAGALVPQIGRFLSHYLPALYFPTQSLCPPLVGQRVTLLQPLNRS